MKKIVILICSLLFILSCVNGPAIKESLSNYSKSDKFKNKKLQLYKIIIQGDNYDPYIQYIIYDKISLYFRNMSFNVITDDDVFKQDLDLKNINFNEQVLNQNNDYILVVIIRTKDLGYSISTLSDEINIFINTSLYNGKGELLTNSLFSRITSYRLSAMKKFHWDIINSLKPIKSYILTH